MLTPEQIPDEVAEAVMHCFHTRTSAKAAVASAINAWPGMLRIDGYEYGVQDVVHLPLTQPAEKD
jgi:hypothetical protein